jgi:hypothetical protein
MQKQIAPRRGTAYFCADDSRLERRIPTQKTMSPHELFAAMPKERGVEILDFFFNHDKDVYRAALAAVAQVRKVRPVFLERKPRAERNAFIAAGLGSAAVEANAANLLSAWLVKTQSALLADFLDALKIKHENGVVENLPSSVDDESVSIALENLLAKYPQDLVTIYLHAFNHLNAPNWENLTLHVETDPRLSLKKA